MAKNKGKVFEELIKESALIQGIDYYRYRDAGWTGEETNRRFTITNLCDCHLFANGKLIYVEAKSRKSSLRFCELKIDELIAKQEETVQNVLCAVLVEFDNAGTYLVPIHEVYRLKRTSEKKSFNGKDVEIYSVNTYLPTPRSRKYRLDLLPWFE